MALIGRFVLMILLRRFARVAVARMAQRGVSVNFLVALGLGIIERSITKGTGLQRRKRGITGFTWK
jgi:hypothetical protein